MTTNNPDPNVPKSASVNDDLVDKLIRNPQQCLVDVTVTTNDGKRIQFASLLLKIRSQYFATLFSSQFQETQSNEIELNLTAQVFNQVLEFMCTDDYHPFRQLLANIKQKSVRDHCWSLMKAFVEDQGFNENVASVLELMKAADYLLFPALFNAVYDLILKCVRTFPFLFCTVWEALWGEQGLLSEHPEESMIEMLKIHPEFVIFGNCCFRIEEPNYLKLKCHCTAFGVHSDDDFNSMIYLVKKGLGVNQLSYHSLKNIVPLVADHTRKEHFLKMLILWSSLQHGELSDSTGKEDRENVAEKTNKARQIGTPHKDSIKRENWLGFLT